MIVGYPLVGVFSIVQGQILELENVVLFDHRSIRIKMQGPQPCIVAQHLMKGVS